MNNDDWLYTPDLSVATAFVKALDEKCGYPNPSTKTDTSVSITTITNAKGTNYAVIVPSVYSPLLKSYLSAKIVLPADRQTDVAITNETKIAAGLTAANSKTNPPATKGTLSLQKFVLVTGDVAMKEVEPPVKDTPIGTK